MDQIKIKDRDEIELREIVVQWYRVGKSENTICKFQIYAMPHVLLVDYNTWYVAVYMYMHAYYVLIKMYNYFWKNQ